ncbi:MAG TPA: hypothetical protein VLY63_28790 [Anaerolineae bacterium]|nr:hypothetical protein [Anaerolineae bacterium]
MYVLRRLVFYLGLLLGLVTVAAAGTVALTYLLTGKLVSVEMSGEKPEVTLMTPDEVASLMQEWADKVKAEAEAGESIGGEGDDE